MRSARHFGELAQRASKLTKVSYLACGALLYLPFLENDLIGQMNYGIQEVSLGFVAALVGNVACERASHYQEQAVSHQAEIN